MRLSHSLFFRRNKARTRFTMELTTGISSETWLNLDVQSIFSRCYVWNTKLLVIFGKISPPVMSKRSPYSPRWYIAPARIYPPPPKSGINIHIGPWAYIPAFTVLKLDKLFGNWIRFYWRQSALERNGWHDVFESWFQDECSQKWCHIVSHLTVWFESFCEMSGDKLTRWSLSSVRGISDSATAIPLACVWCTMKIWQVSLPLFGRNSHSSQSERNISALQNFCFLPIRSPYPRFSPFSTRARLKCEFGITQWLKLLWIKFVPYANNRPGMLSVLESDF